MNPMFSSWVLDSVDEGVLVIGGDGRILAINPAAGRLLGVAGAAVQGQPFAAVFVADAALDELVQAVLDAVYQSHRLHNRLLRLERAGEPPRTLALTTSLLRDDTGTRLGLVVLLNDLSELAALRAREQALNDELSQSNRALTEAYLTLETRNAALRDLTRRVQVARVLATGFVILLFLGIGIHTWHRDQRDPAGGPAAPAPTAAPAAPTVLRLEPRPDRTVIRLTGDIEPVAQVNLVAPLDGTIEECLFAYGAPVTAGQPLFTIAREATQVRYREARARYLQALEKDQQLEDWDNGPEMQRARRGLRRAESSLRTLARKEGETRRLLELGIVPAAELDDLLEQIASGGMELAEAQEELADTRSQGSADRRAVARLQLENAEYAMRELERKLELSQVVSPVDGVVMAPAAGKQGKEGAAALTVGSVVKEGVATLTIGDLTGIAVRVSVDELEVGRIQPGQPVRITGAAFPELRLDGQVASVAAQATRADKRGAPTFELLARVPTLTPTQRAAVRPGMSARLEVVIREDPAALRVPIAAVRHNAAGAWVRIRDQGTVREVPVKTGATDLDSVAIVEGLAPGMEILVEP